MVRGRRVREDSATENLHIRVHADDLKLIRARANDIRGLVATMRSLGVSELPSRTMGGIVSQALSFYCHKLELQCVKAEKAVHSYKMVSDLLDQDYSLDTNQIVSKTGLTPAMVNRLVKRYHFEHI